MISTASSLRPYEWSFLRPSSAKKVASGADCMGENCRVVVGSAIELM